MMADDFSNQERTYFHEDISEFQRAEDTVFPGVLLVNEEVVICDGIYSVQNTGNTEVFPLITVRDIAVAVVVIHCQTKDQRITALVVRGKRLVLQKRGNCVICVFQTKMAARCNWQRCQLTVTGTGQMPGIRIDISPNTD